MIEKEVVVIGAGRSPRAVQQSRVLKSRQVSPGWEVPSRIWLARRRLIFLSLNRFVVPSSRWRFLLTWYQLETLGGVWSRERIYPDLRTNNQLGTFSYPSFDFPPGKYGVNKGEFMPGMSVHQYMCE